jgi:hypothetical protein
LLVSAAFTASGVTGTEVPSIKISRASTLT